MIPAVAARYGGPSEAVLQMCRWLSRIGVEATLATTDAEGAGRLAVPTGRLVEYRGVPGVFFPRRCGERFKWSPGLSRWVGTAVRRFDLVHVHAVFSHSSLCAARAARDAGVPYVVRPLGALTNGGDSGLNARKRLLLRMGARKMLRESTGIHYTSRVEQEEAERAFDLPSGVVIPLGVDESLLTDRGDGGRGFRRAWPALGSMPYVLFLSRIHPDKGVLDLVRAFAEATRGDGLSEWRLVIAGSGDHAFVREVRRRVETEGVVDRVLFTGWLEGELKASALRGAGLVALPSRRESFGLAVAEALASRAPVLVGEGVAIGAEVGESGAGWVVPWGAGPLRGSLERILPSEKERAVRGAAGRRLVFDRFRWPWIADRLAGWYSDLLLTTSSETP